MPWEYDEIPPLTLHALGTTSPVEFETSGDWNEFCVLTMNRGEEGFDGEQRVVLSAMEASHLFAVIRRWLKTKRAVS